ncbi:hypothetical protein DP092_07000 [Pseudomonas sp. MDMC224]|nr:hypothetical protein DP092_07000 [Pseudomonas sp. MDMC224]
MEFVLNWGLRHLNVMLPSSSLVRPVMAILALPAILMMASALAIPILIARQQRPQLRPTASLALMLRMQKAASHALALTIRASLVKAHNAAK